MGKKEKLLKETGSGNGGEQRQGRGPSIGTAGAPIGDLRFSRLHTDPRFQRLPKNKAKVSVDSRFAHMFTEKGFSHPSSNKRGIKAKNTSRVDPLRRYYSVDEEDDEEDGNKGGDRDDRDDETITKRTRGKKDRAKKKVEKATEANEEINEADDSGDEIGAHTTEIDVSRNKTRQEKLIKKRGIGVEKRIAEAEGFSEDTEDGSEELDEAEDVDAQRVRVGAAFVGSTKSGEEFDDDHDESGLEEGGEEEDDDEDERSSSDSSDSESDVEQETSGAEEEEKIPTTDDETRRLAIVNMDWDHIQAVHLLVLMRSFAPKGGSVQSVTIYPSDFGIEQMKEENVHGPQSIFGQNDGEDGSDEDGPKPEKLRQYEISKLRYYYAVVECDSPSTAAHLYKDCDGLEFERTSNILDFRYIPDEMEFKREPRDSASEVPADYKLVEFETRALQHSNLKLTWDDDEPVRVKTLRRNFNREELNEMDFRAYVGSSSESESEGEAAEDVNGIYVDESLDHTVAGGKKEDVRSKYLSLLSNSEEADVVRGKKAEKGNIEIKFHTGLEELSEKLLAGKRKDKVDETVWEAYLRRKKEKKNARKNKKARTDSDVSSDDEAKHSNGLPNHGDDQFFNHGDEDPFDDPFFNQDGAGELPAKTRNGREGKEGKIKDHNMSKKEEDRKKRKDEAAREKKESEKKQAELELLLLDDHMVQNGEGVSQASSLKDLANKQKPEKKAKKKKKGTKAKMEGLQEKISNVANYDDPRFASLFTPLFALDPTDPQYKNAGSRVAEMQRQHFKVSKTKEKQEFDKSKEDDERGSSLKRKAEVSSLVRSLKSKVQAKALGNGRSKT